MVIDPVNNGDVWLEMFRNVLWKEAVADPVVKAEGVGNGSTGDIGSK